MQIVINPTEAPSIRNERVLAALGYIPPWIDSAFTDHPSEVVDYVMNTCYQMGGGPQDGFTMLDDGTMLYSGDPPLVPIAMYLPDKKDTHLAQGWVYKVFQYDYGYVNFVRADGFHMTRMD